jgi:hypothetical protein
LGRDRWARGDDSENGLLPFPVVQGNLHPTGSNQKESIPQIVKMKEDLPLYITSLPDPQRKPLQIPLGKF